MCAYRARLPLPSTTLLCESFLTRKSQPFCRAAKRLVVLSKPAAPQIFAECNALAEKCLGLLAHEAPVCEQGIGVTIIGDLYVRDSVGKALFETGEVVDGECAGASRLFDLFRVVNKVNLRIGAFQQEISAAARVILSMQQDSTLHRFQVSNGCDLKWQPWIREKRAVSGEHLLSIHGLLQCSEDRLKLALDNPLL